MKNTKDVLKKQEVLKMKGIITTKKGMMGEKGNVIIPVEYDYITKLNDNLYAATKGPKDGVVTGEGYNGHEITTYVDKEEKLTQVDFYSMTGKLNLDKKICLCAYSKANDVLFLLDENNKCSIAFADFNTNDIIEAPKYQDYDSLHEIYGGKIVAIRDKSFWVLSLGTAKNIGPLKVESIQANSNGMIIKINGKRGFMDYNGKFILKCEWEKINLYNQYIRVSKMASGYEILEGIYGYNGKEIIPCHFTSVYRMDDTGHNDVLFCVESVFHKLQGVYSLKGKQIIPCCSSRIECKAGVIVYENDGKKNILFSGKDTGEGPWDNVVIKRGLTGAYVVITKGWRKAIYSVKGEELIPFKHKWLIYPSDRYLYK